MGSLPACVCAVPTEARRGHWTPGTGVIDGCKAPFGCWDSKLSPVEEQPTLLTSKSSLQPLRRGFYPETSWKWNMQVCLELS